MHFADRLAEAVQRVGNAVCVGIDPRPEDLPPGFLDRFASNLAGVAQALGAFSREVVEVVAGLAPVVKFQSAFFEAYGPLGTAPIR